MWEYMQRLVVHFSDNIAVGVGQAEQVKTDGDGIKAHGGIFFRTLCVVAVDCGKLPVFFAGLQDMKNGTAISKQEAVAQS